MNKKAIAILGAIFVLIVSTLGFLIYSRYSSDEPGDTAQQTPPPAPSPEPPSPITPVPTPPPSGIVKLTDDQIVSPALFFNGAGITYADRQGNLFQVALQNTNGQLSLTGKKQLGIPPKPNLSRILWPAKGNDFIAEVKDASGKSSWSYFNSSTGAYVDLPAQVFSLDWMPSGTQIMYVWVENGKASLSLADPDTKNYKTLADMWELDNILHVSPYGDQVAYYQASNPSPLSSINSVSSDGKIWKGLVKNGQNLGVLWSPDNQKFLFAKKDSATLKYQLWVYNLSSGEVKNLNLFTTVDKAVWDKDSSTIYAAVPSTGSAGQGSLTVDDFFRADIIGTDKKQYPPADISIDGRDLFLSSAGDRLFFRNAQDGGLYYLDLAQ